MKLILIACMALSLSGCATQSGTPVESAQLSAFKEGTTTEADVTAALGKPITVMSGSDGIRSLVYISTQFHIRGATFIPIVGLFAGGSDMKSNTVTFRFDSNGKMVDYKATDTSYSSSISGSMQPSRE